MFIIRDIIENHNQPIDIEICVAAFEGPHYGVFQYYLYRRA